MSKLSAIQKWHGSFNENLNNELFWINNIEQTIGFLPPIPVKWEHPPVPTYKQGSQQLQCTVTEYSYSYSTKYIHAVVLALFILCSNWKKYWKPSPKYLWYFFLWSPNKLHSCDHIHLDLILFNRLPCKHWIRKNDDMIKTKLISVIRLLSYIDKIAVIVMQLKTKIDCSKICLIYFVVLQLLIRRPLFRRCHLTFYVKCLIFFYSVDTISKIDT